MILRVSSPSISLNDSLSQHFLSLSHVGESREVENKEGSFMNPISLAFYHLMLVY